TDMATDIAQEAMIQAYENLTQHDGRDEFWPWLQSNVVHVAIDRLRQDGRLRKYLQDYLLRFRGRPDLQAGPSPLDVLIPQEDNLLVRACVREAVAQLRPNDRDILLRHHVSKETVAQLAAFYL